MVSQDSDLVFTHGDYCAPNILVGAAPLHTVTGVVDWGYAGVADRWCASRAPAPLPLIFPYKSEKSLCGTGGTL